MLRSDGFLFATISYVLFVLCGGLNSCCSLHFWCKSLAPGQVRMRTASFQIWVIQKRVVLPLALLTTKSEDDCNRQIENPREMHGIVAIFRLREARRKPKKVGYPIHIKTNRYLKKAPANKQTQAFPLSSKRDHNHAVRDLARNDIDGRHGPVDILPPRADDRMRGLRSQSPPLQRSREEVVPDGVADEDVRVAVDGCRDDCEKFVLGKSWRWEVEGLARLRKERTYRRKGRSGAGLVPAA